MHYSKETKTNKKMFYIATALAVLNQSLLPFLDRDFIDPKSFNNFVYIQVFSVAFYSLNFLLSLRKGFNISFLHTFMGFTFLWGVVAQFFVPSAYMTFIICLFIYALFLNIKTQVFISVTIISFFSYTFAILLSNASYANSENLNFKFKNDSIQSLLIITIFMILAHLVRKKELAKAEYVESKFMNLGNQAANILHDIKSQIVPPLNYSQMLMSSEFTESHPEIYLEINKSLIGIKEYVQEVGSLVSFKTEKENINLHDIISKYKLIFESKLKNINIQVNQEESVFCSTFSNFKGVVYNLITNSVQAFSGNNTYEKTIKITLNKNYFEYEDNAGGIPVEILSSLQKQNYTSSKKEGTGLGFYFIHKYAEQYNLNLEIKNKNQGMSVKITFKE